jgi:hypothetical protein
MRNENIECPKCEWISQTAAFHCIRCGHVLMREASVDGNQIIFVFEGGMTRPVVPYRSGAVLPVRSIDITANNVSLVLSDGQSYSGSNQSLFQILLEKRQLWRTDEDLA